MAERKFTDDEIIKALELCIQNGECEHCEYRERTDKSDICPIRTDAFNLINRQNAELEQLKRNLEQCENGYSQELHRARCELADAKTEVERLKYNLKAVLEEIPETKREVAREIFEEIEKIILENTYPYFTKDGKPCNIWKPQSGYDALAELKKKYTEEKK